MTPNRPTSLLTLAAVMALAPAPRLASACLPYEPTINSTAPGDGETHPANAGVGLVGFSLGLDTLTATIDDLPVAVVLDAELSERDYFGYYRVLVVRTQPAPSPGQVVRFQGRVCGEDWDSCPEAEIDLHYLAGEPDLDAPAGPSAVTVDAYDHGFAPVAHCDCATYSPTQYAVTVSADIEKPPGEMVMHILGARPKDMPGADPKVLEAGWDGHFFGLMSGDNLNADLYCGVAYTTDLAGNKSEVVESCTLCRVQEGPGECGFLCGGSYPCGQPEYTCTSIANPNACSQSVLDECGIADTTGGTETGGTGATTGTTSPTTSGGATTIASTGGASSQTSGAAGSDGLESGSGDNAGCACDVSGGGPESATLAFVLLFAPRRRRSQVASTSASECRRRVRQG